MERRVLPRPALRVAVPFALAVSLAVGCGGSEEDPGDLSLRAVRNLTLGEPLALNDDVVLTFDGALDPTTITGETVQLVDATSGEPADGLWIPEGRALRFRPAPPLDAALTSGGFQPGTTLALRIRGYPAAARLRDVDGRSLARSVVVRLQVASDGEGRLLRDASPDRTLPLRIPAPNLPLRPDAPVLVACDEPLDPRTLDPREFELVRADADPLRPGFARGEPVGPIAIREVSLVQNRPEGDGGALLRFVPARSVPVAGGLRPLRYELRRRGDGRPPRLADYSGGSPPVLVLPVWFASVDGAFPRAEGPESFEFDFADSRELSPMLDPSSDGMAHWDGTGRVGIRYPRAAGDGRDGARELRGSLRVADLHATRIRVPAGEELRLEGDGLVVLRAQGRIDLDGDLVRRRGGEPRPMWPDLARTRLVQGASLETLTTWLERARAEEQPWTVVVAGGNLVVRGSLDVDTPLLLVAGGWIRGEGRPRTPPGQFWLLGSGGGFALPHHSDPTAAAGLEPPLVIDPPLTNPLKEPLTFVAISSPAPKAASPRSWRLPEVVAHEPGRGSRGDAPAARVQYLAADVTEDTLHQAVRHDVPMGAVDPESGGQVRLRIELTARPSPGPWDPPFVDRVRLSWNPLSGR